MDRCTCIKQAGCTNGQMHKWKAGRMHRYTAGRMHRYTAGRMRRHTAGRMHRCTYGLNRPADPAPLCLCQLMAM